MRSRTRLTNEIIREKDNMIIIKREDRKRRMTINKEMKRNEYKSEAINKTSRSSKRKREERGERT